MLIVSTVGGPLAASCSIFGILFALPTHAKTYKSVPTAAVPASQSHTDARPSRARAACSNLPAMAESSRLPSSPVRSRALRNTSAMPTQERSALREPHSVIDKERSAVQDACQTDQMSWTW